MILHTTEVSPLPDYRLRLCFNNGECGEVDPYPVNWMARSLNPCVTPSALPPRGTIRF